MELGTSRPERAHQAGIDPENAPADTMEPETGNKPTLEPLTAPAESTNGLITEIERLNVGVSLARSLGKVRQSRKMRRHIMSEKDPSQSETDQSDYMKGGKGRKDEVGRSGVYPASSPDAPGDA
jgi:hypothetical protein